MRHRALIVLGVSGVLGFRLGMVAFPDWQVAVETAQVVAGVVRYPVPTPFFIYHTKLWTVLHQVLAVFLRMGVSEIRLSLVLSGLTGMLSFQALAMFVFALSEDVLLAVAAPLVVFVARSSDAGVMYPIYLMGASHTYGAVGLALFVLVVGLLGAGCYRGGAFLLGLAPAVHPSLGFWLFVIVTICCVWDRRQLSEAAERATTYFVAGCFLTAASLAVQLASAYHGPPVTSAAIATHLSAFFALWDAHRRPVPLNLAGVHLNVGALAIAIIWLTAFVADLPRASAFLLRVVIVSGVLSLVLILASWIPPDKVPSTLLILMPTRVANLNAMTFVVLLLGLVGAYRLHVWGSLLAVLFSAALLLGGRSLLWPWRRAAGLPTWAHWFDLWTVLEVVSIVLILLALWSGRRRFPAPPVVPLSVRRVTAMSARAALALLFVALAVAGWRRPKSTPGLFEDYTNNPVFRVASEGHGILATGGGLHLIQLRTRRPVLLDGGGLDGLPYAPESGPEMARILKGVYDIDFFNPPDEARGSSVIPNQYTKTAWERFSLEKWQQIRSLYEVRQVLTSAGWSLQLPVIAQDRQLRLYQIPD